MDYSKLDGLIPAVIQDYLTREVLMVGFMNADAYARTQDTGYVTFYSRTRATLWTKGETSGNRLAVVSIATDCDDDTLLIHVRREGDGNVCHTGQRTCFGESTPNAGSNHLRQGYGGPPKPSAKAEDPASTSRPAASAASELRERAARTERGVGVPASERAGGPRGEAPGSNGEVR